MPGAILGKFSGKACDSNVFNNNDMHLGRELFENVIASDEYKDAIKRGHYIGYLGHPEDPACQEFQNACIVMTEMSIEDDGDVQASFNLVDTPVGRIVKAFTDAGVQFGISIRGAGDVAGDGEVDPDTFIFRGFDLVAFPAYNDCIPTFQEIAASKDLDKQKKYKKVCATVTKNLKSITSCEALEEIKSQLVEGSEPYNEVEARLNELATVVEVPVEVEPVEKQQVDALVEMYSEAVQEIEQLKDENARLEESVQEVTTASVQAANKIKRLQRIHAEQISSLDAAVTAAEEKATAEHKRYLSAAQKVHVISDKLSKSEKLNLNYSQKIKASEQLMAQKDTELTRLNSKLSETVTASKELKSVASNYDGHISELESRIQAAEDMIFAYQQAYANMLANALGKKVSNLSVTASTAPEALRRSIMGSTSTANIPAKPDYSSLEEIEYFGNDDDDDGIVTT